MHVLWLTMIGGGTVGKEQLSNLEMEKKMVFNFKSHTHLSQPSETVERSHSLAKAPCAENCISTGKLLISLGSSR